MVLLVGLSLAALPAGATAVVAHEPLGLEPAPDLRPEDAGIGSFATAGGAVFASGRRLVCSSVTACEVLLRSLDGGAHWEQLPAQNFRGGSLTVAPGYPADDDIYALGEGGLQVSHDGGMTFGEAKGARPSGFIAMSPGYSSGDRRLLLGTAPTWEYDADLDVATPLAVTNPPGGLNSQFAFDPNFMASGRFFVTSLEHLAPGEEGHPEATFAVCSQRTCRRTAIFERLPGFPWPRVSPRFAEDQTIFVFSGSEMVRSVDGGESFAPVELPFGVVMELASDGRRTWYAAVNDVQQYPVRGAVLRSRDDGRSWAVLGAGTRIEGGVSRVVALQDGTVIAALSFENGGGVLCSDNHGATWRPRCGR